MVKHRCEWVGNSLLEQDYHDLEWGIPVHDDRLLFEFLVLEGAQAGLSWLTVLKKREGYRAAFSGFDAEKIVEYDGVKIAELLQNPGIIRNRLKISSTIINARVFLETREKSASFSSYVWSFVNDRTIHNARRSMAEIPATTLESDAMSKDLKKRGFKFVGSTICYAFMQAVGMVNDHIVDCFRYDEIRKMSL